jgi:hypothetical protein
MLPGVSLTRGASRQGRSQLKINPGAHSIKHKGMCTISKEIYENFKADITKLLFYHGARAPGKANVASPLPLEYLFDLSGIVA